MEVLTTTAQFELQPHLRGELLHLRPVKPEDFEKLFAVSSDPLVWEQHPERLRYQRDVFEKFFQGALDSRGAFVAVDCKTAEIIGSSRYWGLNMSANPSQVEVGYTFLARRCWNKGYNREMKRLMLTHAFQYVDRVVFYIGEQNMRSRTAIEKIGGILLERIERQPKEGAKYCSVVYKIDKADYLTSPVFKTDL